MRGLALVWMGLGAAALLEGCTGTPASKGFAGRSSGLSDRGGAGGGVAGGSGGAGGIATGGAGAGGFVPAAPRPSAGCNKPAVQALGQYVRREVTVAGAPADATTRIYYLRLPAGYDPARPYRTVYLGPGCGEPQDDTPQNWKSYPMETVSGEQGIFVAMEPSRRNTATYGAVPTHYCFEDMAADSVEYSYFGALHQAVEDIACVDRERQFFAGYSSGGWMAHQLGCAFPDVLRAQGSVTGGLPPSIRDRLKTCVAHPVAAFLIHDFNDVSNLYQGSVAAAERLFAVNGCTGTFTAPNLAQGKTPYTITGRPNTGTFSCVSYSGCPAAYPIVFCTSQDQMHGSQEASAVPGFWEFFSRF
jgi:poly(3-hydroxybutyrate) depolymerase